MIGGSFTGIAAARYLSMQNDDVAGQQYGLDVHLFEQSTSLGSYTAFRQSTLKTEQEDASACNSDNDVKFDISSSRLERVGAMMMSFNVSQSISNSWLHKFQHEYPELLSEVPIEGIEASSDPPERPQGWNRATGQWTHCRPNVSIETVLGTMMSECKSVSVHTGCKIRGLEIVNSKESQACSEWRVALADGSVMEFEAIILALPVPHALPLLEPVRNLIDPTIHSVLQKCAARYKSQLGVSIPVAIPSSLHDTLQCKFERERRPTSSEIENGKGERDACWQFEIPLYMLGSKKVTLCVIQKQGHAEASRCAMVAHLCGPYISVEAVVDILVNDMAKYLSIEKDLVDGSLVKESIIADDFLQTAVGEFAPLSPLREQGYICSSTEPPLLLAGDWASGLGSGCVSGALISGEKAAQGLYKLLNG